MANILDGKALSEKIKAEVKTEVENLKASGIEVGLGLLMVEGNAASRQYYNAIVRNAKAVGIKPFEFILPSNTSVNEILNIVHQVNQDERINGLIVLMPLPKWINARRVVNEISPDKDVDGLGAISIGRLAADESAFQLFFSDQIENFNHLGYFSPQAGFLPCTPFGVIRLLEHYGIEIKGKHAVVVGKSLAVGKPLSLMLLAKEATVTVCHKATADLGYFTRQADIVCSATGVPHLIKADMIKEGAVVVDIGIVVLEDGRIVGDVDFDNVKDKASYITPVPGGVGPVTIAMLLENTVRSARRSEAMKSPFMLG